MHYLHTTGLEKYRFLQPELFGKNQETIYDSGIVLLSSRPWYIHSLITPDPHYSTSSFSSIPIFGRSGTFENCRVHTSTWLEYSIGGQACHLNTRVPFIVITSFTGDSNARKTLLSGEKLNKNEFLFR